MSDPGGPAAPRPWLRRLAAAELWLTLPALPVLILREIFPPGAPALAFAWLAGLWVLRRLDAGRWTRPSVLDAPVLALLATLPGAILAAGERAAAFSRAQSLLAAIALAFALANSLRRPQEAWRLAGLLLSGGLALVGIGLVGVDWLPKFAPLAWVTDRLPRLIHAVPHATLPIWGVAEQTQIHPNSVAALLILFLPLALGCLAATLGPPRGPADHAPPPWLRPLALAVLLLGAAVFTIASVVRLISLLYRDEIAVLRLVGATEFFIRGPFYLEGILQGLLGAGVAIGGLYALFLGLGPHLADSIFASVAVARFLTLGESLLLLLFGAAAGLAGAIVSLGREGLPGERSGA